MCLPQWGGGPHAWNYYGQKSTQMYSFYMWFWSCHCDHAFVNVMKKCRRQHTCLKLLWPKLSGWKKKKSISFRCKIEQVAPTETKTHHISLTSMIELPPSRQWGDTGRDGTTIRPLALHNTISGDWTGQEWQTGSASDIISRSDFTISHPGSDFQTKTCSSRYSVSFVSVD